MLNENENPLVVRLSQFQRTRRAVIAATALLLTLSVSIAAQERKVRPAPSVEESFNTLHQALSTKATNLLADAQRARPVGASRIEGSSEPSPNAEPELPVPGQIEPSSELTGALKRLGPLRPAIEPILRGEGIPPQMEAVALVESGAHIDALSPKGARGLWQLMPETARRYGLAVTSTTDERLDPLKSTRAAARYLRDLYVRFGEWPLVLAAYNAGEDKVERAIQRTGTRDFLSIYQPVSLPGETRRYVPAVLKAMRIVNATDNNFARVGNSTAVKWVVYAAPKVED
jgi:hypothetical protein